MGRVSDLLQLKQTSNSFVMSHFTNIRFSEDHWTVSLAAHWNWLSVVTVEHTSHGMLSSMYLYVGRQSVSVTDVNDESHRSKQCSPWDTSFDWAPVWWVVPSLGMLLTLTQKCCEPLGDTVRHTRGRQLVKENEVVHSVKSLAVIQQ